ncbi:nucleotidyltransferase domain-containing protein [Candidatus Cloacimonadota bacterium]
MKPYGIPQDIWDNIVRVISSNPKVKAIILFGSRAKGNFQLGSDIDLAIKGIDLSFDDLLEIRIALDELNLPWEIDLQHYESISDPAVIEHIDRIGIALL